MESVLSPILGFVGFDSRSEQVSLCLESCVVVLNGRQDRVLFGLDEISQKFLMINFT
jgi:hypothetical protein